MLASSVKTIYYNLHTRLCWPTPHPPIKESLRYRYLRLLPEWPELPQATRRQLFSQPYRVLPDTDGNRRRQPTNSVYGGRVSVATRRG